jgi:hypothetical protein
MSNSSKRLAALEARAAQRRALLGNADDAKERILARLDVIGQRLRAAGVVVEIPADELAEQVATVKARIQKTLKEIHSRNNGAF